MVDEQMKEYWKWRDTLLYNEDVLLETLCFDILLDSPYKLMYGMLKHYHLENNKKLRDAAWAFLSDLCLTQLCLKYSARTLAAASLYCGARHTGTELPDANGKTWWENLGVQIENVRRACEELAGIFRLAPGKEGDPNIYVRLE